MRRILCWRLRAGDPASLFDEPDAAGGRLMHWFHRHGEDAGSTPSDVGSTELAAFNTIWFGDANFPLSEDVFGALLTGGANHMFVMPTTKRRAQVEPAHPYGHYDPTLGRSNPRWRELDAAGLARQVIAEHAKWEFGSPWVFCNEISYSQWRAMAIDEYRRWTVTYAQTLAAGGLVPAVYSPIKKPNNERAEWSVLAEVGYVAIEGYLDGPSVAAARDPSAYCASQYSDMRSHFEAQGVPVERSVLVEHYAQTPSGTGWGRGGLALEDWLKVIPARVAGARMAGFTFIGSYGWGYNRMQVPDADNVATATAYIAATQSGL